MVSNNNTCRIKTFKGLKAEKKSALITFITAGDPDFDTSKKILIGLPKLVLI